MEMLAAFPGEYRQGRGILREFAPIVARYGGNLLIIGHERGLAAAGGLLEDSLRGRADLAWEIATFAGECSRAEIDRLGRRAREVGAEVIVGVGGGKTQDVARAVAHFNRLRLVMVPTAAVNDAPGSRTIGIYREDHVFEHAVYADRNPDLVLADTEVLVQAPVRLLVAGMGDALSKKYEVAACRRSGARTRLNSPSALFAADLAELAFTIIRDHGWQAVASARAGVVTEAFELAVEANLLLSGIAFENGGLAAAHAVGNGLSVLPEACNALHGEKVGFGLLVQLVLEGRDDAELAALLALYRRLGLPTNLHDLLGVSGLARDRIRAVAEKATVPGSVMENMPGAVTAPMLTEAIILADALGAQAVRS